MWLLPIGADHGRRSVVGPHAKSLCERHHIGRSPISAAVAPTSAFAPPSVGRPNWRERNAGAVEESTP